MFIFSIKDDIMRGKKRSILRLTVFMLMLMITVTMAGCRNIPEDGINSDLTEHISVELFESIEAEKDSELILSWVNDNREDLQFNFAIWNIEEKNGRIVSDGEKYICRTANRGRQIHQIIFLKDYDITTQLHLQQRTLISYRADYSR